MSRLADGLSRFFGRVEILARGADDERRGAERALDRGHHLEARAHARALLARVPRSPLGLALWADAAEACWQDDEVVQALCQLGEQAPWRQEVWLRLGLAGLRADWPDARSALERAAAERGDLSVARAALFTLADLDIDVGDFARAKRWLARVPSHPSTPDPELSLRRAECAIASGAWDDARKHGEASGGLDPNAPSFGGRTTLGGRRRLVRARLAHHLPDGSHGAHPIALALGAWLLDAPGAEQLLVELVAASDDAALVARVRACTDALVLSATPRWQAAYALAEGRRDDAREALMQAVKEGDTATAGTLLALALRWQDLEALRVVADHQPRTLSSELVALLDAARARDAGDEQTAIAILSRAHGAAASWAASALDELMAGWVGRGEQASRWATILAELGAAAGDLDDAQARDAIAALGAERQRPLFVAILGEFNAGKSTLINALLGTDVAPTGIRPTTASLHWVAWAKDSYARVLVHDGPDRVVPHERLKAVLDEIRQDGARVARVFIHAPLARLERLEILDTPGFNAPDTSHADEARRGIEEAHVALWLLDATAPLKHSERVVIEQIAALGVPVQVLVNKSDRVDEGEIARVMSYVSDALAETAIVSLSPPIAFSAQLALKGRLGDDEALARSHWQRVESLLETQIIERCDALRERALRRKARRICAALGALAAARAHEEVARRDEARANSERRAALAASWRRDRVDLGRALIDELAAPLSRLAADALPIEQLSAERRTDPEVRSYLIDKSVARLTAPLCDALARRAGGTLIDDEALARVARAAIAGASAAVGGTRLAGDALSATIEALIASACDELEGHGDGPAQQSAHRARQIRLAALLRALESAAAI